MKSKACPAVASMQGSPTWIMEIPKELEATNTKQSINRIDKGFLMCRLRRRVIPFAAQPVLRASLEVGGAETLIWMTQDGSNASESLCWKSPDQVARWLCMLHERTCGSYAFCYSFRNPPRIVRSWPTPVIGIHTKNVIRTR